MKLVGLIFALTTTLSLPVYGKKINDEWIIKFKTGEDKMLFMAKESFNQEYVVKESITPKHLLIKGKLAQNFSMDNNIEYIQPNFVYHTLAYNTNDPQYEKQWGMIKIKAHDAWSITKGEKSVVVAVIDTGVDYTHEDLRDAIWNRRKMTNISGA